MRAVIAGGTGTIGRALARDLAEADHQVVILSRSPDHHKELQSSQIDIRKWQVESLDEWGRIVDGVDVVVNFAGESLAGDSFLPDRWTPAKMNRISESRINAGTAINQAVEQAEQKPHLLIQASAIGYYGPLGDEIVTEKTDPGSDILANICREWESTTAPVEKLGVRRVVIRTGLILSTESGPLPRLLVRFRLFSGGPFGSGNQWWSWIHLDDVVKSLRFIMENEVAAGPVNLTAPNPTTNREFSKILGRVMSRPSFVPLPGFALKGVIGDAATIVLDGQRVMPEQLHRLGYQFSYPQLEGALLDLLG